MFPKGIIPLPRKTRQVWRDGQELALTAPPGQERNSRGCPGGGATAKVSRRRLSTLAHTGHRLPSGATVSVPPHPHPIRGLGAPGACNLPGKPLPRQDSCPCLRAQPDLSHRSPQPLPDPCLPGRSRGPPLGSPSVLTIGHVFGGEQAAFPSTYKAPGTELGSYSRSNPHHEPTKQEATPVLQLRKRAQSREQPQGHSPKR